VEHVAGGGQGLGDNGHPISRREVWPGQGRVEQVEAVLPDLVGGAGGGLVRAGLQEHLAEDVPGYQSAPSGAEHVAAVVGQPVVTVLAGGRDNRHGGVTEFVKDLAEVGSVLPEAAGSLGRRHEESVAVGIEVVAVDDPQEIPEGYLLRIAFLAAAEQPGQFECPVVGGGCDGCVDAHRPEHRSDCPCPVIGHPRYPQCPAFEEIL